MKLMGLFSIEVISEEVTISYLDFVPLYFKLSTGFI